MPVAVRLGRGFQQHVGIFIKVHKAKGGSLTVLTLVTQSVFPSYLVVKARAHQVSI